MEEEKMKRYTKLIALILALSMALSLCACGGGSQPSGNQPTDAPEVKDSLVVEISEDPATLFAGLAASTIVSFVSAQIFDTLVVADEEGNISPALAESWELSEDGKDLTFKIREGVTFHNGDPLTVEDVAFSLNLTINGGYADLVTSAMDKAEVVDENHVVVHFKLPYGNALYNMTTDYMQVLNKKAYEADPDGFARNPIGTGAYKFVEWTNGDHITLTRNDDWWGGASAIKDVTFRVYTDGAAAAIALQTGELDLLTNPLTTDRQILMDDPNLFYDECESATAAYMFFNMNGPFQNKALREAVFYAIDKEALLLGAIDGVGTVLQTPFITAFPGVDADYKSSRQFDLEKAQAKMIEAGYPDGLDINVVTRSTSNYTRPVEILQNQLGKIGIRISISTLDASAWSAEILRTGNFDLNMMIGTSSFMSLDSKYGQYTTGSGQNFFGISFPELDEAFDRERTAPTQEGHLEACRDIVKIVDEEVIMMGLYSPMRGVAANKDLKGVEAHASINYRISDLSW